MRRQKNQPNVSESERSPGIEDAEPDAVPSTRSFWQVAGWVSLYKLAYLCLLVVGIYLLPDQFNLHLYLVTYHIYPDAPRSLLRFFITWDSEHYLGISQEGYRSSPLNVPFFPLWPLLIRGGSYIFGSAAASGIILSNVLSISSLAGFYVYAQRRFSAAVADRSLLLLLALPGAIFFNFPYTESLFLGLSVLALNLLDNQKYVASGFSSLLAALSRPVGAFWVLIYAAEAFKTRSWKPLTLALFPIAGYGIYLLVMYLQTGNAFSQFSAYQSYGNNTSVMNIVRIPSFIQALLAVNPEHDYAHSPIDRIFFLWLLATLPKTYAKDKTLFLYSIAMGVLPAMLTLFISYSRYVVVAFPMVIVSAEYFLPRKRLPGFLVLAGALFMLQIFFLILHVNNNWAG